MGNSKKRDTRGAQSIAGKKEPDDRQCLKVREGMFRHPRPHARSYPQVFQKDGKKEKGRVWNGTVKEREKRKIPKRGALENEE